MHSSVLGLMGCFQTWTIVNSVAMTMRMQKSFLNRVLDAEFMGHVEAQLLVFFKGESILFFKKNGPADNPTLSQPLTLIIWKMFQGRTRPSLRVHLLGTFLPLKVKRKEALASPQISLSLLGNCHTLVSGRKDFTSALSAEHAGSRAVLAISPAPWEHKEQLQLHKSKPGTNNLQSIEWAPSKLNPCPVTSLWFHCSVG